jgi:hypothetical protein
MSGADEPNASEGENVLLDAAVSSVQCAVRSVQCAVLYLHGVWLEVNKKDWRYAFVLYFSQIQQLSRET